jgi:hypothetical protein
VSFADPFDKFVRAASPTAAKTLKEIVCKEGRKRIQTGALKKEAPAKVDAAKS